MTAEELHTRRINGYQREIRDIFQTAAEEAARLGIKIDSISDDHMFSFDDYPQTKVAIEALMQQMYNNITVAIGNGIDLEWEAANKATDAIVRKTLSQARKTKSMGELFSRNEEAREAFKNRQIGGLNLSDRVWKYTQQFKDEIEMGLDLSIGDGLSAQKMSRRLRRYLQEPNKLFRRVKDKHGSLKLSQRAAAYHPGRGVYRSSYKNALRLTATETNMAYRAADYERWQHLDFVVGFEVKLSSNHPEPDICDDLKGRYPKTFKFTGWHPFCRCHAEPILKTEKELEEDTQRILNGEETDTESVNEVTDVPSEFTKWIKNNADRIEGASERGTLPYFIRENISAVNNTISGIKSFTTQPNAIIEMPEKDSTINKAKKKYLSYDEDWEKAYFNEHTGGFNVYHCKHQFTNTEGGGNAEKKVGRLLAENEGKQVEFLPENGKGKGRPDLSFDMETWDVKYIDKANINTIRTYIKDARKADNAIFYFTVDKYSDLRAAITREVGRFKSMDRLNELPNIYYINKAGLLKLLWKKW